MTNIEIAKKLSVELNTEFKIKYKNEICRLVITDDAITIYNDLVECWTLLESQYLDDINNWVVLP